MILRAGEHYIEHDDLARKSSTRHGFFTRNGGVSQGIYTSLNAGVGSDDDPQAVAENRARIAQAMGVAEDRLFTLFQCHSATVHVVDQHSRADERQEADGMVTRTPGLALGILTADCAPVLLADDQAEVVGACHAGWKGAISGIVEATLDAMEQLGAQRRHIMAVVGPCIHQASYEVDAGYRATFCEKDAAYAAYFLPSEGKDGHFQFDLPGFVLGRLEFAGVREANWLAKDTYIEENAFFSNRRRNHRGEPDYGRQLSVIALR